MVLQIVGSAFNAFFPTKYTYHIVLGILVVLVLRVFSQGRATNRERDLHGRKIIITGGFTPLGLTILQSLAERGAHIIALSPQPTDDDEVTIIITLLRNAFSNENIYADYCDLTSPSSIRSFCTRFLTGDDQRIDAIVFCHEYRQLGAVRPFSRTTTSEDAVCPHDAASLATFLLVTLLLPALLVSPVERDIRIITLINPFYAAATAATTADLSFCSQTTSHQASLFLQEGKRALRTAIFMRHLQRILDALPTASQIPKAEEGSTTVPIVSPMVQRSNIISVSVSPGMSRMDTICSLLDADWTVPSGYSRVGVFLYILIQPVLWFLTKSPKAAMQTVLHALFLPTPFKVASGLASTSSTAAYKVERPTSDTPEEILKPGALYAECAVVKLKVPCLNSSLPDMTEKKDTASRNVEVKGGTKSEVLSIPEDYEFGGEATGRSIWEAYEAALKAWEKANPNPVPPPSLPTRGQEEGTHRKVEEVDVYR